MSIRTRIEDALIQYAIGRPEGALLSVLAAISATSRRRRPDKTPSERHPGREMGDGEAFELFLRDEMPNICRVQNYNVNFRGAMRPLQEVLYRWFRCELVHEGSLPGDVHFISDPEPGTFRLAINEFGLHLSHGWLDGLANSVIYAPENHDLFGSPPKPPLPIYLPKVDLTIAPPLPAAAGPDSESDEK